MRTLIVKLEEGAAATKSLSFLRANELGLKDVGFLFF